MVFGTATVQSGCFLQVSQSTWNKVFSKDDLSKEFLQSKEQKFEFPKTQLF